jgi:anti-anti-sigma regulatory factor/HAMP domain-containing protein
VSRLKLRTRLIILTLGSALVLTLVTMGGTLWSYGQLRRQVAGDTSQALDAQNAAFLQQIIRERTDETETKLATVRDLVLAAQDYLHATAFESTLAFVELREAPNGWQWGGEKTATLLSPSGNVIDQRSDMQIVHSLDALLPSIASSSQEIERISFFSASGVVKTYPYVEPQELRPGWKVSADQAYMTAGPQQNPAREPLWVPLHPSFTGGEQVISIASPIYFGDTFRGVLAADISLTRLSRFLETIGLEQGSFAALIDGSGRVVAAPLLAQEQLIGRQLGASEQWPILMSDSARAAIGTALGGIVNRQISTSVVALNEHEYRLAYGGVETLGWSLIVATPHDRVIATTRAMTMAIDRIVERAQMATLGVSTLALLLLIGAVSLGLRHWFTRPLDQLIVATHTVAAGELRPIAIHGSDEIGQLAQAFNHMVASLEASQSEIVAANHRLEQTVQERTADLQLAVDRLEESTAQQRILLQTLRDVSTPILPVIHDVLVVPLIGQLDEQRLANVSSSLLAQIERGGAHVVLIDVTGTPVIDTAAARGIVQLVQAARLLGCESLLVGIVPEVAQTLVTLGVDLSMIHTAVDLQSGIELIMSRQQARHGQPALEPGLNRFER